MIQRRWISTTIILGILRTLNVRCQFGMPMYPPPPPMMLMAPPPPPVAVPIPFPVPVPVVVTKKTTTTTTTTESPQDNGAGSEGAIAIPIPLPFGFPMPFVVPQAPPPKFCADKKRPKNCPPCPPCMCTPSCTPSFYSYCSPCHQKCRCKGNEKNGPEAAPPTPPSPIRLPMPPPMPMPMYPMVPGPPPVFIFPFPPVPPRRAPRGVPYSESSETDDSDTDCDTDTNTDTSSDTSDTDSDSDWVSRKRRRRYRIKISRGRIARSSEKHDKRKNRRIGSNQNSEFVKPMLTYMSKHGDVKFQKRISQDDAENLMRDTDGSKSVEISRRSGGTDKDARKVIFRPPSNRSITNLTVSFNVV